MAHQPMLRPDPSERSTSPNGGEPEWIEGRTGLYLAELAATLAFHGGGTASADLALDLMLNEVVDQARLATTATGAAIALARGEEMVCRATTGDNAPDLGVRLNTHYGLSGACVQTGEVQHCDDTEADPRVDAETCRHLGVRSILIVPVLNSEELLGVFEIFSPRPYAFGDRDVQTLQALSRRIVENIRHAAEPVTPPLAEPLAPEVVTADEPEFDLPEPRVELRLGMLDAKVRPRDYWTIILTTIVIALALVLGWLVGHVGSQGVGKRTQPAVLGTVPHTSAVSNAPNDAASARPASAQPTSAKTGAAAPGPATAPSQPKNGVAPGGLVVYENGKVVFQQMTPAQKSHGPGASAATNPVPVSAEIARTRLLQRVQPQYPVEAKQQHIQGPVVLKVVVGKDGNVQELQVISGDAGLAKAAGDAVRQWRFKPYQPNGQAIEFETRITVTFTLPSR